MTKFIQTFFWRELPNYDKSTPLLSRLVFFYMASICLYLFFVLGINYTPINDSWVFLFYQDQNSFTLPAFWRDIKNSGINPRVFSRMPYLITTYMDDEGFVGLKTIMLSLSIASATGVYLLAATIFHTKRVFAVLCALTYFFFSIDGTLFWLGAFGVNISMCAMIYSLYFFKAALVKGSYFRLFLSCILIMVAFSSYVGAIIFVPVFIGFISLIWVRLWKKKLIYFIVFGAAFIVGNIPMIQQYLDRKGRVSAVADYSLQNVIEQFNEALSFLFVKVPVSLINPNLGFILPTLFFGVICYFLCLRVSRMNDGAKTSAMEARFSTRDLIVAIFIGLALIIAGFVPYSFSEVRIEGERTLLYARAGFVFLTLACIAYIIGLLVKDNEKYKKTLACVGSIIFALMLQDKAQVAQSYNHESKQVRAFMADLLELVPSVEKDTDFLIFVESGEFTGKGQMVLNRPSFILRYLYENPKIDAVTTSDFYLKRYPVEKGQETLKTRGVTLNSKNLISVKYARESGFTPLNELTVKVPNSDKENYIELPGVKASKSEPYTKRQNWFRKQAE